MHELTDNEGIFLVLVRHLQPTTAYQVARVYEDSPVTNYKTHGGKIYPIIARLHESGFLSKSAVEGDRRGTEEIYCTAAGEAALRRWAMSAPSMHMMLDDPFRMKMQAFDLLTEQERMDWIRSNLEGLQRKLDEVTAYGSTVDVTFQEYVHDNAVRSIRMRIDWLNSVIASLSSRAQR